MIEQYETIENSDHTSLHVSATVLDCTYDSKIDNKQQKEELVERVVHVEDDSVNSESDNIIQAASRDENEEEKKESNIIIDPNDLDVPTFMRKEIK